MVTTKIGKVLNGASRPGPGIFPFYPLQPLLTPKYCNSVTLWKKGESGLIYWLQFLLQFLIEIKKNCNQLSSSSGYNFTIHCYTFSKNLLVTVTSLNYNYLTPILSRLQVYSFLEQFSSVHNLLQAFTEALNNSLIKKSQLKIWLKQ